MAVYSEGAAEYAEVSSTSCRSGQQSPSPYATATLIGSSKVISIDGNRTNMFYTNDYSPNQNNNYNRSIHSETYYNPNMKFNIVENRLANTMAPNMYNDDAKRNRLKLVKPQNFRLNFGGQGEKLYVKVGDLNSAESSQTQAPPQTNSHTWNPQNFNIYENHLHRQAQQQMSETTE